MTTERLVVRFGGAPLVLLASGLLIPSAAAIELVELVKKVEPSVVRIDTDMGVGSGVIVDNRGYVFTNFHVIEGAKEVTVTLRSGEVMQARGYLAADPSHDLAVLKIDQLKKPAAMRIAEKLPETGEHVAAFGNPEGFSFSTSEGIVSAVRSGREVREIMGADAYRDMGYSLDTTWIQTTAAISHGNSGGPLVNMKAEVVGLNTWIETEAQNISFAISVPDLKRLLERAEDMPVRALATLPKARHGAASRRGEEFKVTLPSGRVFTFDIFDTADALTRPWDNPDQTGSTALITHPNGALYAVAGHEKGVLNGLTLAQYENKQLMVLSTYLDGKRHGLLKSWDQSGRPMLFAQYAKGKRDGFSCLFGPGKSWILIEHKNDDPAWIQLASGVRAGEGFSSRKEAEGNSAARELLDAMDKAEATLKTTEIAIRKQVSANEQQLRKSRAAQLAPQKRARIQARSDQHAADEAAFIQGLYRRAYGR